jgi:hypothetical protein
MAQALDNHTAPRSLEETEAEIREVESEPVRAPAEVCR